MKFNFKQGKQIVVVVVFDFVYSNKFNFSAVSGPIPRVGDRVICQMKMAEGFGTQTRYKYFGFDVRLVQTPTDTRRLRNK